NQIQKGQHAVASVNEKAEKPREPQWRSCKVGADAELAAPEGFSAALADISNVDEMQKPVGDEVVPREPYEIRQEQEQRYADTCPEPTGRDPFSRRGKGRTNHEAGYVKHDCVLGFETQPHARADGQPPAWVLGVQKPEDAVRDQHPPQKIKRGVLELGAF